VASAVSVFHLREQFGFEVFFVGDSSAVPWLIDTSNAKPISPTRKPRPRRLIFSPCSGSFIFSCHRFPSRPWTLFSGEFPSCPLQRLAGRFPISCRDFSVRPPHLLRDVCIPFQSGTSFTLSFPEVVTSPFGLFRLRPELSQLRKSLQTKVVVLPPSAHPLQLGFEPTRFRKSLSIFAT